jgi:small subunit ribosomal protein S17
MADETENTEIEETPEASEAEADVVVEETAPEAEEPVAKAASEAEAVVQEAAPESEEPVAEAEPAADEPDEETAPTDEPTDDAEPIAADAEAEPVANADAAEAVADGGAAPAADAEEAPVAAVSGPKPKRKRLPRSERPQKTRPKRVPSAERKPITRLPKPEHERGRRQERQGIVVSDAADKTIVVRVDVVKLHPRYKKVVKRSTRFHAHDEENKAKLGDVVLIVETRPLSRMKRWRLQEIVEAAK